MSRVYISIGSNIYNRQSFFNLFFGYWSEVLHLFSGNAVNLRSKEIPTNYTKGKNAEN